MDLTRPMVKPGLRRVWRGPQTLQLGVDVPTPLLLHPVDDAVELLLRSLDGRLQLDQVLAVAAEAGLAPVDALGILRRLAAAGLLADAAVPDPHLASLPRAVRDSICPDLEAAGLQDPRPDAAVVCLRTRRELSVLVLGDDRLGRLIAVRLRQAGVGRVDAPGHHELPPAADSPERLVVVPASLARTRRRDLAAACYRHLLIEVGETVVRLGPLVVPGRTACFGCLEQGRLDRDPGWAPVSAQLAGAPGGSGPASLLQAAAALAVLHLLDWAVGGRPPELGAVVEVGLPHGQVVRRPFPPHPACGCAWLATGPENHR